jgi:hypothetical protein
MGSTRLKNSDDEQNSDDERAKEQAGQRDA